MRPAQIRAWKMKHIDTLFKAWKLSLSLLLFFVAGFAVAQTPGDDPTIVDSCTIYIGTGYYYVGNGWNDSYMQLLQDRQVVAMVQHHQWTPNTYSVKIPANVETDFNWISDNTNVSFFILSSSGELLHVRNNFSEAGIFFSFYPCSAPRKINELTVIPDANIPEAASISWTNPTHTVSNDMLQTIDSIELLKNDVALNVYYNPIPGMDMQYVDNSFKTGDYYTLITYNGSAASLPVSATGPTCTYKLVMSTGYTNWHGASVKFLSKGHLIRVFSLTHNGTETAYFDLPNDWITLEHYGVNGSFSLYDVNDSLILSGPGGLPASYLWYNGCSQDIPDTVSGLICQRQGSTVNLSWSNPTHSIAGDSLTAISRIEIRRNEQLIHTFTNTTPGDQLSFSDIPVGDGTYQYAVQCFNESGGGVPAIGRVWIGNNGVLHNLSNTGDYVDTSCLVSISNDTAYTIGGTTTLTIHQSDTTKLMKISGSSNLGDGTTIKVYAGTENEGALLASDTLCEIVAHPIITFVFDIPVGATPNFHYSVECVNTVYEQPDTNIAIVPDNNGIIYVTQEGAGLRNGSSWANATPWLNRALNIADTMTEKPVIWVAQGTYYGTPQQYDDNTYAFIGHNDVNVYGGFAGNEQADYNLALRDLEQNETKLDGLLHHTVVHTGSAVWNGVHIQHGTIGCKMVPRSTIRHCIVSDCLVDGVYSRNSSVSMENSCNVDSCIITNNGGMGINASISNISYSQISFNGENGIRGRGYIHHCIVNNNKADGFYCSVSSTSTAYMDHCLFANNDGSGMSLAYNYVVSSSTVVNNGNGITLSTECKIRNCIIYGNHGVSLVKPWYVNEYDLDHCAVEGDYIQTSRQNIPLASPSDSSGFHPGFVNPTMGTGSAYSGGDWHLLPISVCINRGTANYNNVPNIDLDGNNRIQQGITDIGAYESPYEYPYEDGKIIYVKTDGEGDGSSWSNATADLNHVLETAWIYGPETRVWVAQGTYPTPNHPFYVKDNLHLMGGFVGNESADYNVDLRNTFTNATILDGQQQNRVLHQTYDFDDAAFVDGFTLTRGQADVP